MNKTLLLLFSLAFSLSLSTNAKDKLPYKNKALPVEQRVEDLLSRMTLEEKVGQTLCLLGWDSYDIGARSKEQGTRGKVSG